MGDNVCLTYKFKKSPYSSHSLILNALPAPGDGRRVLDVGCATGYLASILAERGYEVTGMERKEGTGTAFPESVRLVETDLESEFPPIEGLFDFVICADILEHLRDPQRMLQKVLGLLRPDGVVIASLPNSGNIYFRLVVLSGRFPKQDVGLFDRTHVHFFTRSGWAELFSNSGFRFNQISPTGIPVGLVVPSISETLFIRLLEQACFILAKIRPTLFAYQFVVHAKNHTR